MYTLKNIPRLNINSKRNSIRKTISINQTKFQCPQQNISKRSRFTPFYKHFTLILPNKLKKPKKEF